MENKINEALLRDSTKKQLSDLRKLITKGGGDIGDTVRKSEKSKEDKMPNTMYMDNPFSSNRKIDTWENFSKNDAHIKTVAAKSRDPKSKPTSMYTFIDFTSKNK